MSNDNSAIAVYHSPYLSPPRWHSLSSCREASTRMSIEFCILASGSSGNCTIVRTPAGVLLIDAGIGPRIAAGRMDGTGVALRDVRAICLTHLDSDHFRPSWLGTLLNRDIRVFCHRT